MAPIRQAVRQAYAADGLAGVARRGVTGSKRALDLDVNLAYWKERAEFALHERGLLPFDALYSESYYANMLDGEKRRDAREFCVALDRQFDPGRVIEFGCGAGRFMDPLTERGVEVFGIDRSTKGFAASSLPIDHFAVHDLRDPYETTREYDLALCIEVLEHIPAADAATAVASVAEAAPVAIVTAAPPGQGGTHHVNERPPDYWKEQFAAVDMRFDPEVTAAIADAIDPRALTWLTENLLVFEREADDGATI